MKSGRRPTVKQKATLMAADLHPSQWLIVKNLLKEMHIVHRISGEQKKINLTNLEVTNL